MVWILYNVLFTVVYVLMLPRFFFRMWKRGGYRKHFMQRLGIYDPETRSRLEEKSRMWVHAVSVGEIYVALHFMEEIRARNKKASFVLSTTTSTGYGVAMKSLKNDDVLIYFPTDFPWVVKRALGIIRPQVIMLTENELWPNMIRAANNRNIPVVLINGRMSEKSFRGYSKLKAFASRILKCVRLFLVQSRLEEKFLTALGAEPSSIMVMGSAKYDVATVDPGVSRKGEELMNLVSFPPDSPLIVGGSTWPGEEAVLLDAYQSLKTSFEGLKLVLVPRHAERRLEVEAQIRARGIAYVKRSDISDGRPLLSTPDVMLLDTTGELKNVYACASVIFVGKSLAGNKGGQNIIEPAMMGKPVVVGSNMQNFASVMPDFVAENAILQVADSSELESCFRKLLSDSGMCAEYGRRARKVVEDHKGVVRRSVLAILDLLDKN